jgi:hypothetical protein
VTHEPSCEGGDCDCATYALGSDPPIVEPTPLDCIHCGSNDGTHYPGCPRKLPTNPRRVIIESPFGKRLDGSKCTPEEISANLEYFWRCVKDSLSRGEAPFGSHGFYPNVLDDATPEERSQGIAAGFAWARAAELRCFYIDRGETPGMRLGYADAIKHGQDVCYRRIE